MTSEVVWRPPWPWMLVEAIEICLLCSSSQESPQHQEKVRKNKFSDGDVVHKKVSGKPAITRDAGTLTRAASTDVKAIQVSLPGNEFTLGLAIQYWEFLHRNCPRFGMPLRRARLSRTALP